MSIKPIDLQTNISQMHEVAKGEQGRNDGITEQQHVLEKESNEKSRLVRSRLEENKNAERTIIMREEKGEQRKYKGKKKKDRENQGRNKQRNIRFVKDEKIGSIIDIKK